MALQCPTVLLLAGPSQITKLLKLFINERMNKSSNYEIITDSSVCQTRKNVKLGSPRFCTGKIGPFIKITFDTTALICHSPPAEMSMSHIHTIQPAISTFIIPFQCLSQSTCQNILSLVECILCNAIKLNCNLLDIKFNSPIYLLAP